MMKTVRVAFAILASCLSSVSAWASISVSITPTTVEVLPGGQAQFTATVNGSSNGVVLWNLSGTSCSGITCGQISSTGLYLAPSKAPSPNVVTVTATALADLSATASAAVIIGTSSDITVTVSPATVSVLAGQQQSFVAFVSGSTITGVRWSLSGAACSSAAGCGIITQSGTYVAPAAVPTPAQVTVIATSVADPSRSGSAVVTVILPVAVQISPATASVNAGLQQQFTASVSNTSNTAVTWSVSCAAGTGCGAISAGGLYTAPASPPSPALVTVTATSVADPTRSGTAEVTILPPVAITVAPASVLLQLGTKQQFTATVTNTSNTAVKWSVSGSGCSGAACGTITSTGLYTAPSTAPASGTVTVTATSVADPAKSAKATVTLAPVSVSVTPASATVTLGGTQQFTAAISGTTNQTVSWTLSGAGCSGASCGVITSTGLYTAPFVLPTPAQITVTATSAADPAKSGSAIVTLANPIIVTISPTSATVIAGAQQKFLATVSNTSNTSVTWSVSGAGCTGAACGTISASGLYTAPATVPSPALVTVKVASVADSARFATAAVTVVPPVVVSISPLSANVVAGSHQQFTATVTGVTNTAVTWSVTGAGCTGSACGVVSTTGLYSAPGAVPNPAKVSVTATSVADSAKSASAVVTILPPESVTVSPALVQVVINGQQQFTATVTGAQNTAVTWSLKGSGCSGSACGTVSSSGLYTAPAAVPSPAQVTLTAQSVADATKSGSATIIIILPVHVTVSPASAVVAIGLQQQFRASVTGSTNTAVHWTVSGAGCSGDTCGTISSSGLYTAPDAIPSPAVVTIRAASAIDPSQSASATVTLSADANTRLDGRYAFQFTGFNSGSVYQAAGEFTANGAGKITAGLEDTNSAAGPATDIAFTGTYAIGGDNRGVMTLSTSSSTQTFTFTLNFADTQGRFIETDATGTRGSGSFQQQDPSAFTSAALKGLYALSLAGRNDAGSRIGALGSFDFTGLGTIPVGSMDVNNGGHVPPTFAAISGAYLVDATGRGTLSLSVPGLLGGSFRFAFYVVSAQKLFLVSIDPLSSTNPIFAGPAELQSGAPYLTSSFTGATVFSLGGEQDGSSQVAVGQIVFDGVSQPSVHLDQNAGGTITADQLLTGAYSVSVNGVGDISLDDSNGHEQLWDMYAIGPNHAFLMDLFSAAVGMGELLPQSAQAPFSAASILGTYWLGSGEPLVPSSTLFSGFANFDGKSAMSGIVDESDAAGTLPAQALSGTYSVSGPVNGGRAILTLPSSGESFVLWIASSTEVVGVETDSTNSDPVILHFEQ